MTGFLNVLVPALGWYGLGLLIAMMLWGRNET